MPNFSAHTRDPHIETYSSSFFVKDKYTISKLRLLRYLTIDSGATFSGFEPCLLDNYPNAERIYCAKFDNSGNMR